MIFVKTHEWYFAINFGSPENTKKTLTTRQKFEFSLVTFADTLFDIYFGKIIIKKINCHEYYN